MAVLLGFLGVLAFSGSLPATRVAVEQLDATVVGVGRAVVAGLLGLALLLITNQPRPSAAQWRRLTLVALGVVVGFPLFTALALRSLSSAHGAVIVGLLPAATAAMAVVRAGERPTRRFWLATGIGLVAVLVFAAVQGAGAPEPADALVLLAVAFGALGYAEGGALSREIGGWQTICWALVLALPVVTPVAVVAAVTGDMSGDAEAWAGFAYVCLFSMFLGFFAWYAALARGGARIGQVQLAQPVLTLAIAAVLLGERVTLGMVLAALVVLASVVATQRTRVEIKPGAFVSLPIVSAQTPLEGFELVNQGKVRDVYDAGEGRLLMVVSDRISTYDVVHPNPIPDKGKVLTGITDFWLGQTESLVPNHLISYTDVPEEVRGRAMLVEKLEMIPIECVVRGYITGSGWKDYLASGKVCGIELPDGLEESQQLPEPIFTPTTKGEDTGHDEALTFEEAVQRTGDRPLLEELRRISIAVYEFGAERARERGIILADTKFELGRRPDGTIVLGDEVLTPDSSRFWPAEGFEPGRSQPSFDKQQLRDWASSTGWDKSPPAPEVPPEVVDSTRALYIDAYERVTGEPFQAWLDRSRVKISVLIRPKEGILDPQGQAVERALPALGFEGVTDVRVGRLVELEVEDSSQVDAMCQKLLANPLVEDYEIQEHAAS